MCNITKNYGTVMAIFSVIIVVAIYTITINNNIGHMIHKHWSYGSLAYSMYATVSKTMSCIYYSNAFTAVMYLYSLS